MTRRGAAPGGTRAPTQPRDRQLQHRADSDHYPLAEPMPLSPGCRAGAGGWAEADAWVRDGLVKTGTGVWADAGAGGLSLPLRWAG